MKPLSEFQRQMLIASIVTDADKTPVLRQTLTGGATDIELMAACVIGRCLRGKKCPEIAKYLAGCGVCRADIEGVFASLTASTRSPHGWNLSLRRMSKFRTPLVPGDCPAYIAIEVNQIQRQHVVAVDLLEKLGLENIKLEIQGDGRFRYFAWSLPLAVGNGSPRSRYGVIRRARREV
jgi:hypothetical protein